MNFYTAPQLRQPNYGKWPKYHCGNREASARPNSTICDSAQTVKNRSFSLCLMSISLDAPKNDNALLHLYKKCNCFNLSSLFNLWPLRCVPEFHAQTQWGSMLRLTRTHTWSAHTFLFAGKKGIVCNRHKMTYTHVKYIIVLCQVVWPSLTDPETWPWSLTLTVYRVTGLSLTVCHWE